MLLRDFTKKLMEGGNLELDNPQDPTAPHRADEIDLKVHQRNYIVPILDKLLNDINRNFNSQYKTPIWSNQLLASKQFLGGSSLHFFNTSNISDEQFVAKKPKVGDIDTQCNKELEEKVKDFLTNNTNKQVGDATLLGFSAGNEQFNALFQFQDPPMKIQIDFEFGRYSPETNSPDEWFKFSHSSEWKDIQAGVKGVFHKYIYRALSGTTSKQAYIAKMAGRGSARAIQISNEPETINTASFAVASKQGGGVSQKFVPYIDPATNQPMVKNGLPVMQEIPSSERDYEQKLDKQFITFFGQPPQPEDTKLQWSFVGTLDLINKYIDQAKKPRILEDFLDICFEPGSQMITRDDPQRDAQTKFVAIDLMIEKLGLQAMRPKAVQMAKEYEDEFNEVEAYKKAHPEERQPRAAVKRLKAAGQPIREADEQPAVKAQLRKGMPHLRDLKPADFLDLVDELQSEGGRFKLQNIPLNVKIDGFGGRFGKNSEGKPFMGTSRTEPRYQAGFVDYHKQKGTTDPEILGRAENFDKLFYETMDAIKLVDSKLGPDFLVDKQVTCEVLFLPFATKTDEGKLKFVGIEYDNLPQGVDLVMVPFRIVQASTGEEIPDQDKVIQQLADLGQSGNVMFMSNRLTQKEGLDVTEIINPLENLDALKQIVSDTAGKRDRASLQLRREVEEKLKPVQIALEKAIDEDPNIVGKNNLGQDYEGIVINSRLGPIKVTSQQQKDIITKKNAAKAAARADQGRDNANKTAVVAIGSFVGHVGHEQLWDYTIKKAEQVKGDPYLFIGNAQGKDDPIPPAVKVQTWHKMYPEYAKNISTVTQEGGSLMQKIKHELINPLPGQPPRYDNIIIMVGEDQAKMPIAQALMKAVNKFQGYEHVKVSLEVTPRGTGMSFTKLRNILKDPHSTPEQQYAVWAQGFDEKKLGKEWILHLMDLTRKGMGIQMPQKQQPVQHPVQQPQQVAPAQTVPVSEMRLLNSLVRPQKVISEKMMPKSMFVGSDKNKLGSAGQLHKGPAVAGKLVGEAPIEMDPTTPMNPTIYGHQGANSATLQTRMLRASGQLKDLAARAAGASPMEWQVMIKQFDELKMNIEQIKHALDELAKKRKKGGVSSRGIDPNISEQEVEETEDALQYATQAHAGQTRSGGEPYIGHPVRVAQTIQQYKQSHNIDALISAAYLHDTIEDTDTTHEALHDLFGGLVASLVLELTSDLEQIKKVGKKEYLAKKMAHDMSSYGLVIKLADRLDNVKDIATAKTPEWRAKYKAETEHIMDYLEKNRTLSGTHKKLISLIRAKLGEINQPQQSVAEGLDRTKRTQIINFIAKSMGWGISDLELATDSELIYMYKKIKAGEHPVDEGKGPCWTGYKQIGMKKKGGKQVPNCVPVSEEIEDIFTGLINQIILNEAISYNK